MARARSHDAITPLDSLLDTMANVVGILVLLLVVTQISVGEALDRILSAGPGPTAAERDAAEGALRDGRRQLAALEAEWQALAGPPSGAAASLPSEAERARQAARLSELEAALAAAKGELARVEVVIDEEQRAASLGERIVRLPDPRPAPKGATEVLFFVRYERLNPADRGRIFDALERGWREAIGAQPWELRIPPSAQARVVSWFSERRIGDGPYRWRVVIQDPGGLQARLTWAEPDAGETGAEIRKTGSDFARQIADLDPARHYLRFYVWSDSFETYLAARQIAEDAGFSVGWRPFPADTDPIVGDELRRPERID